MESGLGLWIALHASVQSRALLVRGGSWCPEGHNQLRYQLDLRWQWMALRQYDECYFPYKLASAPELEPSAAGTTYSSRGCTGDMAALRRNPQELPRHRVHLTRTEHATAFASGPRTGGGPLWYAYKAAPGWVLQDPHYVRSRVRCSEHCTAGGEVVHIVR